MAELISSSYSKETFPELFTFRFGMTKKEVKNLYKKKGLKPIFEGADRLDFIGPPIEVALSSETNLIFEKNSFVSDGIYIWCCFKRIIIATKIV